MLINKNFIQNKIPVIMTTIFYVFILTLLIVATKGNAENGRILYQHGRDRTISGPFELSNSTSRFALTESIGEEKSLFLREDLAKFSSPDVVDFNGKFLTIFTPGVSFIGVPFYLLGQYLGIEQLLTFFSISLFAFLNIFLISKLAQKLGASKNIGVVSGLIFLFATNALSYSQTYTQHHISTTFILLCILNASLERTKLNNLIFGILYGLSALIDIPNIILIMPVLIYVLLKNVSVINQNNSITFKIKLSAILLLIGLLPTILIFGAYNYETTGSYTKLAQNIGRSKLFQNSLQLQDQISFSDKDDLGNTIQDIRPLKLPFKTRAILNGFYTLLISEERAWIHYSPIVLIGIIGYWILYKSNQKNYIVSTIIGVIITNIVLYSMFGDPWGGWAFGPRYLIPSAALLCAGIAIAIEKHKQKIIFNALFVILLVISIYINTLGVTTTQAIPPKQEARNLSYYIPYTYKLNILKAQNNESSNLMYNYYFKGTNFSLTNFVYAYSATVSLTILGYYVYSIRREKEQYGN